jgi:hypothetical protein
MSYDAIYYQKNKDKIKAQQREYYKKNRDKIIKRTAQWQRDNHQRASAIWKKSELRRKYGITLEDWFKLYNTQKGLCAICSEGFINRRAAHVDHDHTTNKVRGLLCRRCNTMLGFARDDLLILQNAMDYLKGVV